MSTTFGYFTSREMCEAAGTEHPKTLASMNNLALVLRYQGTLTSAFDDDGEIGSVTC